MSGRHTAVPERLIADDAVEHLRAEFDSSFAVAPAPAATELEDLLTIRVAGMPYAIRFSEISAVHANKHVTPLPNTVPELIGLAGFRSTIVAVYDLRVLLGAEGTGPTPWVVVTAVDATIGIAFDEFEGHLRVPGNTVETDRPIIRVGAMLEAITTRQFPISQEP